MKTSTVLNLAADHIERYGHHKGAPSATPGSLLTSAACIHGAIGAAVLSDGYPFDLNASEVAREALREHLDMYAVSVWNDHADTTAEQVVEALRAAAVIEAAKEIDVAIVTPALEAAL